jgi:hypothetical protein
LTQDCAPKYNLHEAFQENLQKFDSEWKKRVDYAYINLNMSFQENFCDFFFLNDKKLSPQH